MDQFALGSARSDLSLLLTPPALATIYTTTYSGSLYLSIGIWFAVIITSVLLVAQFVFVVIVGELAKDGLCCCGPDGRRGGDFIVLREEEGGALAPPPPSRLEQYGRRLGRLLGLWR